MRLSGPPPAGRVVAGGSPGAAVIFYGDSQGSATADVHAYATGATLPGGVTTLDARGLLPRIFFPNGATTLWYSLEGAAPLVQISADDRTDQIGSYHAGNDPRIGRAMANLSPAAGVITALRRGIPAGIHLTGDSTGEEATEWFGLLGKRIGAAYPNYNVWHRTWNDTNQCYDQPTALQTGPKGDSYVNLTQSGALRYAAASITGDIDVRWKIAPTQWNTGAVQTIAAKYETTANQKSWWFRIATTGALQMVLSTDGSATVSKTSTANPAFADGAPGWVRVVVDVDNGASGSDTKFYTSTDGVTWTQLGTTITTATAIALFDSTAPYQIGAATSTSGSAMTGKFYWGEIKSGIDTGRSVVPPLAATWEPYSFYTSDPIVMGGSPTLLLVNGSIAGQNVAYFDDSTRRPKIFSPHDAQLIMLSTNHNEAQYTRATFLAAYSTFVTNVKSAVPNAPIVCLTQNPSNAPNVQNKIEEEYQRAVALTSWARSQAGVYPLDTMPAFNDLVTQVDSGGTHPTKPAGEHVWANYVYDALFCAL